LVKDPEASKTHDTLHGLLDRLIMTFRIQLLHGVASCTAALRSDQGTMRWDDCATSPSRAECTGRRKRTPAFLYRLIFLVLVLFARFALVTL
jgi:hypothetical protein